MIGPDDEEYEGRYCTRAGMERAIAQMHDLPPEAGPELLDAYCDLAADPNEVIWKWTPQKARVRQWVDAYTRLPKV